MKLVLLPGLDGSGDLFEPLEHALPESLAVKTVLYPFKEGLGYDVLTEYVNDILPTDEPFVLLAESFSGPIAVTIAAEKLPMMKGLILVNTFVANPNPLLIKLSNLISDQMLVQPPKAALRWLLRKSEANAVSVDELYATIKGLSPELVRSRMGNVLSVNVSLKALDIDVPVMVLRSRSDTLVKKSATQQLVDGFAGCEVHTFDTNHFLLQTMPKRSASLITEFIYKLEN